MTLLPYLLILMLVVFMACENKVRAKFVVNNNSGQAMDSVRIIPYIDNQQKSIGKGMKKI